MLFCAVHLSGHLPPAYRGGLGGDSRGVEYVWRWRETCEYICNRLHKHVDSNFPVSAILWRPRCGKPYLWVMSTFCKRTQTHTHKHVHTHTYTAVSHKRRVVYRRPPVPHLLTYSKDRENGVLSLVSVNSADRENGVFSCVTVIQYI